MIRSLYLFGNKGKLDYLIDSLILLLSFLLLFLPIEFLILILFNNFFIFLFFVFLSLILSYVTLNHIFLGLNNRYRIYIFIEDFIALIILLVLLYV